MPRSNRPRRRGPADEPEDAGFERLLLGMRRTETRRDGDWNVQPHSGSTDGRTFTCPGCGLVIAAGVAHLVAWRADGLMGDSSDLAARRHWHTHCWRIRS